MSLIYRSHSVVYAYCGPTLERLDVAQMYKWRVLTQDSISSFFSSREDSWRLRAYSALLRRGCIGHVLHAGSEWAAVQWIATPDSGGPRHLPRSVTAGRYWCFNEHTRDHHRRRGLWKALKNNGIRHVRETSGDPEVAVFSDTQPENFASRKAHEDFGFAAAGMIEYVNIRLPRITTFSLGYWDSRSPHPTLK